MGTSMSICIHVAPGNGKILRSTSTTYANIKIILIKNFYLTSANSFFFADIDWVKVKEKNIKTSLWCRKTIRFHSGAQNVRKKLKKFVYLWFHDYLKKYFTKFAPFLNFSQSVVLLTKNVPDTLDRSKENF